MKKLLFLAMVLFLTTQTFSQAKVSYQNWSDTSTYILSPSPLISGYGYYSDSLAEVYENKTFFVYDNGYYCIESWADYYYWYTHKYWYKFKNPELYEYYYFLKDDYGMASYIAGDNYLGDFYPSLIMIDFEDRTVTKNRLKNAKYIAASEKRLKILNKGLSTRATDEYNQAKPMQKNAHQQIIRHPKTNRTYKTPPTIKQTQNILNKSKSTATGSSQKKGATKK